MTPNGSNPGNGAIRYSFDAANQLNKIETYSGAYSMLAQMNYDGLGNRAQLIGWAGGVPLTTTYATRIAGQVQILQATSGANATIYLYGLNAIAEFGSQSVKPRASRYFKRNAGLVCCMLLSIFVLTSCVNNSVVESVKYQTGQATLIYDTRRAENPESKLDLDEGNIRDNADADIALIVSGGTGLFNVLQPINGAHKSTLAGKKDMSLGDCKQHLENLATTNIPDFPTGERICILTNRGQLALIEIGKVTNPDRGVTSIQMNFVTEIVPQTR